MFITSRVFTTALLLTGLAALAGFSPLRLIAEAMAQSACDVAKPVSLPEMALGPANASVTITEYASMTCSHCAAFNANVFPKIKSEYIDTGKVRYVFREFPLDSKAAVASMLARCIAKDDVGKYFAVIDMMFKKLDEWSLPADPLQGLLGLHYPLILLFEQHVDHGEKFSGIVLGDAARQHRGRCGLDVEREFPEHETHLAGVNIFRFDLRKHVCVECRAM